MRGKEVFTWFTGAQSFRQVGTPALTGQTLDWVHARIHDGYAFAFSNFDDDTDSDGTKDWSIQVPNTATRYHLALTLNSSLAGLVQTYEDGTISAAGTALTLWNKDRNATGTSDLDVKSDPVFSSAGNEMQSVQVGGGRGNGILGAEARENTEWILGAGGTYLIRFTSQADNNKVTLNGELYEVV